MPNHLTIPFKKSYTAYIRQSVRQHLFQHSQDHPDAYKHDIAQWETLRAQCVALDVHLAAPNAYLSYHAQLVFALIKLPSDIGLDFSYAHVFAPPSSTPITLSSIVFERAAVLFNLAALYAQLAAAEDRSSQDGIKRAMLHYQNAAGSFAFLRTSALPKLVIPPDAERRPLDLTSSFVHSLEFLMLAQAQECAWQRAVADQYKNGLIARLAAGVASLYTDSLDFLRSASPQVRDELPSSWILHLETKQHHFRAAAQYRKSIDDLEANNYGDELRRLIDAEAEAKHGYNSAKRGGLAPAVVQDIKSLLDALQKSRARAERDNDLIYHKDIPPSSAIKPIQDTIMVQSILLPGLSDPKSVVSSSQIMFRELLSWGAREAVNIYNDNKQTLIKERIIDFSKELDNDANNNLRSLNLPSSLEALERPVGLPPSLLKKAEEVRSEQGPERIETSLENVELLSRRALEILDEAMDVLDTEASEDETARKDVPMKRLPSHEANRELVQKRERYGSILTEAARSDEVVRQKWRQWEKPISRLTLEENELETLVPSSTISTARRMKVADSQTLVHARTLRGLLESLDDICHSRDEIVSRAQRRSEVDDIKSRIMATAEKLNRDAEITPAMFTDVSDEELGKYDRFIQDLVEGQKKQQELLEAIKSTNEKFLSSRKADISVKEREQALQNLDAAYEKYREITRNLEEGHKFYNDMANILIRFKEACKIWGNARSQETQAFYRKFASIHIKEPSVVEHANAEEPSIPQTPRRPKRVANLPTLTSSEWQAEELPPPPSPPGSKRK